MNAGLVSRALWTAEDAAAATAGRLIGRDSWIATGVSIDTRTLEPGDLFVALKAERDGHAFVAQAFAKGAAAALVSDADAAGGDGPMLVVPDTLEGLRALARAGRARSAATCVAITGSVGKTTVKELLGAALAASGPTHYAVKSYNNHIGVPLTLARLPPDARFAVFEVGMNHRGEIAPLAALIRPHVAVVTWIAPAHIENLGSLDAIADEKADIYAALEPGGVALAPSDAPCAERLLAAAAKAGRVVRVGRGDEAEARLIAATPTRDGQILEAEILGVRFTTPLSAKGPHFAHNAVLALAAAALAGGDPARAEEAVAAAEAGAGRGQARRIEAAFGAFTLIDDAYNANPASVAAALETLGQRAPEPGGRRIAALGDMLELGPGAGDMHAGLAGPIRAAGVNLVYCAGPLMKALWEALPAEIRGGYAETADALAPSLTGALRAGDIVLVKGSNGSRMGGVVEALARLAAHPRGT